MRLGLAVFAAAVVAAACSPGDTQSADDAGRPSVTPSSPSSSSPSATPSPAPTLEARTAIIEGDAGPVLLDVEVADEDDERQRGLMGRQSLPERSGMVFLYFRPTTSGFWMKDTLIPLSIAFFDRDGQILRIIDMEPCRSESCRVYEPGVSYTGALEVNQGFFEEHGISEGDEIRVTP